MTDREMEMNMSGERRCRGVLHVVRKGDTLYQLGKKYGVKVSAIMMSNPYVDIYNLQVGDELCIPKFEPVQLQRPGAGMRPRQDEAGTGMRPVPREAEADTRNTRRGETAEPGTYDTIDYDYLNSVRDEPQEEAAMEEAARERETEAMEAETVEALSEEDEPELSNTLKELKLTLKEFKDYMKQYQK